MGALPSSAWVISNNHIEGTFAAIESTSDNAGATPSAWVNAPFYNNTIKGAVLNTTMATPTAILPGNNVQV